MLFLMMPYELTGGARIGMGNASFPLAKLKVDRNKLELNASLIGNLVFAPEDIVSIEPHGFIPLIGKGIKINHRVSNYSAKVIFWTFKKPEEVIAAIQRTGFLNKTNTPQKDKQIIEQQQQGGFPIKGSFIMAILILWNAFIGLLFIKNPDGPDTIDRIMPLAIGLLLLAAILPFFSSSFRRLMLKKGRGLEDVRSTLYLIILVGGIILLGLVMIANS